MNWIDAVVLGLLVFGIIKGAQRGLIRAMATPVGIFLGLATGYIFADPGVALMRDWVPSETARVVISFAGIFVAVFFIVELVGALLNKVVNFLFLPWIDKLGGATGGLLSSSLVIGIASGIISRLAFDYPAPLVAVIDGSKTLEVIHQLTPFVLRFLPGN